MGADEGGEDVEALRQQVRALLGDDAAEQEELLQECSVADLQEMLAGLGGVKKKSQKKKKAAGTLKSASAAAESVPLAGEQKLSRAAAACQGVPASDLPGGAPLLSGALAARAGIGRAAFKKTPKGQADAVAPKRVQAGFADDDSDFEGNGGDTKALMEVEVSHLCQAKANAGEAERQTQFLNVCSNCGESVLHEEDLGSRFICALSGRVCVARQDDYEEVELTDEQQAAMDYFEELELKNDLHFKSKLWGLTRIETGELFEQHGCDAPKPGDFEIVKQLLADSKRSAAGSIGALKKTKMRYMNGEAIETKEKYIWEKKETHEAIRATTQNIRLIGNSSAARKEHRLGDDLKKKGPVSNTKKK